MHKYEIMYILKADLDEEARKAEMESLHAMLIVGGGKIEHVDETTFGMRELAYPIKDETKGFYVVIKVSVTDEALNEFNRKVRHNLNVLRHLVIAKHE